MRPLLFLALTGCAACAPRADLRGLAIEDDLAAGRAGGTARVDDTPWAAVLDVAADEAAGRVDYDAVPVDALDAWLQVVATADLDQLPEREQEALLINAYNALTINLVLEQERRPVSIRDLKDPWGERRWVVGGHTVSLDDLEHGLLRPLFKDPRLHFALNCASVGCPPLQDTPYRASDLDAQLDAATRETLARPGWLREEAGTLHVTRLLDWYGDDFTADGWSPRADSKAAWLATFGPPHIRGAVDAAGGNPRITFLPYDWKLNDAR
jgi:hypothetical protein